LKEGLPIHEPNQTMAAETMTEEGSQPESSPAEHGPSLDYLSCGAVRMEATLSQTIAKTALIKGTHCILC